MKPSNEKETEINAFKSELETIKEEIMNCELQKDGRQVAATIAGYAVKKVVKEKTKCMTCLDKCTEKTSEQTDNSYTNALSGEDLYCRAIQKCDQLCVKSICYP